MAADHSTPSFTALADLASSRVGGRAIATNDEFFAPKSNLLKPAPAVFIPGKFTARGKWMDGWESRRRRGPGHDWAVVRLGAPGRVTRVEIDTNHFKGNYPDSASLETCLAPAATFDSPGVVEWTTLLPPTKLRAHHRHFFTKELRPAGPASHVRLNIFPDGGVSRLRVYGTLAQD